MLSEIKFSVVMAVYKNDNIDHFQSAINSILNQTLPPSEVIICIDGPVGNDFQTFFDNFNNIIPTKFIKNDVNRGPGFARHAAIISASYDIIAIMDSDDISVSSRFELQINFMHRYKLDVVGSFIDEFDLLLESPNSIRKVPLLHAEIVNYCKWRNPMNHVSVMFKKNLYLNAGGYPFTRVAEDHELFYRMLKNGALFGNINEVLVHVRSGFSLLTRRRGLKYLAMEMRFIKLMYDEGFLNLTQLFVNFLIRALARLSPRFLLSLIYKYFLRKQA